MFKLKSFGAPSGRPSEIRARWLSVLDYEILAPESPPSRLLPACRTKFIETPQKGKADGVKNCKRNYIFNVHWIFNCTLSMAICSLTVSLFNGISTFVGYLTLKPSIRKKQQWYCLTHRWGIKKFIPFPRVLVLRFGLVSLFNSISTFVGYCCRVAKPLFSTLPNELVHSHKQLTIKDFEARFNKVDPVDGAHFDRPWCQQHGSGRVCHVSEYGSQPWLPGAGAGEAEHLRHAAKTDILRASRGLPHWL